MRQQLCFASNNKHKLEEVRSILGPDFLVHSLSDVNVHEELPETRDSFEGNSHQKAEYLYKKINLPCFADDSGLEVEALNGAPGVYSARYAGLHKSDEDNLQLLLKNLTGIKNRKAQFRTVITFIGQHGTHFFQGIIKGSITQEKRGDSGFGYDPIFIPEGYTRTFAEMTAHEKNAISHRSVAVKRLAEFLTEKYIP